VLVYWWLLEVLVPALGSFSISLESVDDPSKGLLGLLLGLVLKGLLITRLTEVHKHCEVQCKKERSIVETWDKQ